MKIQVIVYTRFDDVTVSHGVKDTLQEKKSSSWSKSLERLKRRYVNNINIFSTPCDAGF